MISLAQPLLNQHRAIDSNSGAKDASTLAQILPKDSFTGIVVSDDAAIYQGFSLSQKCWAHLLRKAIRFALLDPNNKEYDSFLKGLLSVYRKACKASVDQRLKDAGRTTNTLRGAQRRTILVSVLESLKLHLAEFTLTSVQAEVESWWKTGESLFSRLAKNCGLDPPTESRLKNLIPLPKAA